MERNYRMEQILREGNIPAKILLQKISGDELFVSPHWHRDIELNLMLMGKGYFLIDGRKEYIESGDLNIINSYVIHSGAALEDVVHEELVTILWDYDFFLQYCEELPQYKFVLEKNTEAKQKIRNMIMEIAILYREQSSYYEMKILALLCGIGRLLLEFCLEKNEKYLNYECIKNVEQMHSVINYINEHYREEITLNKIASYMNMSPTYFCKKFKKFTDMNFYDCLIQCRLKNARDELMNSEKNVTEIAYNNGFSNVKSFIEYFKKYYHTTPKQYKQNYKNE